MDTVTQIALGATIGALFHDRLGRRGVLCGALMGLSPDLDVLLHEPGSWEGLVAHRGVTHSVFTLSAISPLVGWLGWKSLRRGSWRDWSWLSFWGLITHPLLDTCTSYGTQLLAPWSDRRFSTDGIAILDPLYTLPLLIAMVTACRSSVPSAAARKAAAWALGLSSLYLLSGHGITHILQDRARKDLTRQGVEIAKLRTPAAMLLPGLRRAVALDSSGRIWAGQLSIFHQQPIQWASHAGLQDERSEQILTSEEGRIFRWFSDDFLLIQESSYREIQLLDLRYGLYLSPLWTPFSATALFSSQGELLSLTRNERPSGMDGAAEWREGWRLMWGRD